MNQEKSPTLASPTGTLSVDQSRHDGGGVALCLSSSFLGYYAHVGVLNALNAHGIHPSRIAGVSSGAIAGSLYATGLRGEALRDAILRPSLKFAFWDWSALLRLPGVATSFWSTGLFSGRPAVSYFRKLTGNARIEDLGDPMLEIGAANITSRQFELHRSGDLGQAVIASCAVPALLRPQEINGDRYLDGGLLNESPYEHWLDDDSVETIIVHKIEFDEGTGHRFPWNTVADTISWSRCAVHTEMCRLRLEAVREHGKRVIFITTRSPHPGLFQGRKGYDFYELGQQSVFNLSDELAEVAQT